MNKLISKLRITKKIINFTRKKKRDSKLFFYFYCIFRGLFAKFLGLYPFSNGREILSILTVLNSGNWNSAYSTNSKVYQTEMQFCEYLNVDHCILVPSGGVAIEILMRILKGSEKDFFCKHIRHTCPAQSFAIQRSGVIPLPTNPDKNPFSLPKDVYHNSSSKNLVLSTHFWGYPENITTFEKQNIIEDCCLSFSAYQPNGAHVGTESIAGIFSFGCLKPIQAGEGGLICTNNSSLAKEIRIMQNYGSQLRINNSSDVMSFGLNGRLSCIQAAIISEQLKTYDNYINLMRSGVYKLKNDFSKLDLPIDLFIPNGYTIDQLGFSAVLLKISSVIHKQFKIALAKNGIETFDTFFQDILSLSYFKKEITNTMSEEQKKEYIKNIHKNSIYNYPNTYIAIPRKWIPNRYMRSYLKNAIVKSFKEIL